MIDGVAVMKTAARLPALVIAALFASPVPAPGQTAMLPPPGFHHLHLNSVDPDAAIDFYVRQFPASAKTSWGGLPALTAPNSVLVLFTRVATAPATAPQSAIWHFGWHVTDTRESLESYKERPDVTLLPLYTTDEGG